MGNGQSTGQFHPSHVRIYRNLLGIQNIQTRSEMIRTLLAAQEYVTAARAAGVYSHLLAYLSRVDTGQRPTPLPGEMAMAAVAARPAAVAPVQQQPQYLVPYGADSAAGAGGIRPMVQQRPQAIVTKARRNEKALNYFQSCLQVLGLEEEVALTEEALKRAYKRAAIKAHPDKGGSEEDFEAVTRAHAYLGEILLRVKGGRTKEGKLDAPENLRAGRATEAKEWDLGEPVKLNPQKLDLDLFNKMFEQTRIPDPEEDGYGDWLKGTDDGAAGPKFSGGFNRDVFNRMFDDEAKKKAASQRAAGGAITVRQPEALTLAPTAGVELGRGGGGDFTAAANASLKFTDLKNAYTNDNMITTQVADVNVESRNFEQYSAQWKAAPKPLTNHEMSSIAEGERAMAERERQRQLRAAHEQTIAAQHFARMKQMVITNGPAAGGQQHRQALEGNSGMRRIANN